jgi:membrane associated rhomboid family serine protease
MEPTTARILVRSHRQAMDWSLVLVSQGIESTIVEAEDGSGWGLLVGQQDYTTALRTLRQYRLENRGWPWQQAVFRPGLLFDWGSLGWTLLICLFYTIGTHTDLEAGGLMDGRAVAHGQWWRLFTAVWLHADLAHLATNATIGVVLLGLAMGRYGTGVGLLAAYLAGAGGNLVAGVIALQPHRSLGASGMVMGCLGLLAAQTFSLWRQTPHAMKFILSGICGALMLFMLLALSPGTDVMAHLGGFVCGLLLGALLCLIPEVAKMPKINLLAGLACALLVIVPWWFAVRSVGP